MHLSNGLIAFTGTTDKNITVSDGGTTNITFNGVTGNDFTVKGNSTVNLTITDESTMTNVTVEEGSKLQFADIFDYTQIFISKTKALANAVK